MRPRDDDEDGPAATREQLIEDLRELIRAIDRRVPRLERTGETDIAQDAAALKDRALARIDELQRAAS